MFGMVNKHNFVKGMVIGVVLGVMLGMGGTFMTDSDRMRDMQRCMTKGYKKCKSFMCNMF